MNEPTPIRVQRKRTKGWKAPLDANGLPPIYVGRGSAWGNLWREGTHFGQTLTRAEAVEKHAWMLVESPHLHGIIRDSLRGRNLMCWCNLDGPCHAETLLIVANR